MLHSPYFYGKILKTEKLMRLILNCSVMSTTCDNFYDLLRYYRINKILSHYIEMCISTFIYTNINLE